MECLWLIVFIFGASVVSAPNFTSVEKINPMLDHTPPFIGASADVKQSLHVYSYSNMIGVRLRYQVYRFFSQCGHVLTMSPLLLLLSGGRVLHMRPSKLIFMIERSHATAMFVGQQPSTEGESSTRSD